MDGFSGSNIPAFRPHVKIFNVEALIRDGGDKAPPTLDI
jgi:hypothetical protein